MRWLKTELFILGVVALELFAAALIGAGIALIGVWVFA